MEPEKARKLAEAECTTKMLRQYDGMFDLTEWMACVESRARDLEEFGR